MSLLAHPAVQEYAEYQVVRGLLGEKEGQSLARPEEKARHEQVSTVLKAEEEGEISTRQAFALLDKLQEPQSQENTEVLTRDELPKMADVLQSRYDSLIKRQSGEMAEGETLGKENTQITLRNMLTDGNTTEYAALPDNMLDKIETESYYNKKPYIFFNPKTNEIEISECKISFK